MDCRGRVVAAPTFDRLSRFSEGRAVAVVEGSFFSNEEDRFGVIDETGRWIVPPTLGGVGEFRNGLAPAALLATSSGPYPSSTRIWGYIDRAGKWAVFPQYRSAQNFSEGLAAVSANGPGFIDPAGKEVLRWKGGEADSFSDGLAAVTCSFGEWGYIDRTGALVIPCRFSEAGRFHDGRAVVSMGERSFYIDRAGQEVTPLSGGTVQNLPAFSEGLVPFSGGNEKWGFKGPDGRVVIEPSFSIATGFSEGLAMVGNENAFVFIDKTGRQAIPGTFPNVTAFSQGFAGVFPLRPDPEDKYGGATALLAMDPAIRFVLTPFKRLPHGFEADYARGMDVMTVGLLNERGLYYIDKTGRVIAPSSSIRR